MDRTAELNSQFESGLFLDSSHTELPLSDLAQSMAVLGTAEVILA